jgi:glutathione S-transferase
VISHFSLADILVGYQLFWADKYVRQGLIKIGPNAKKYLAAMKQRPAWQAATADKKEFLASKL